jgi:hypothetical protein
VQDEPTIDLYRAAEVHRHAAALVVEQRNLDLLEQRPQRHIDGAIDDHTKRPLLIVLADIREDLAKLGSAMLGMAIRK